MTTLKIHNFIFNSILGLSEDEAKGEAIEAEVDSIQEDRLLKDEIHEMKLMDAHDYINEVKKEMDDEDYSNEAPEEGFSN